MDVEDAQSSRRTSGRFGCRVAMLRPYKNELKVILVHMFMYHYSIILAIPVYITSHPDIGTL